MKKSIIFLLVILISCSVCFVAFGEYDEKSDSVQSRLLQVLDQKGILLYKENTYISQVGDVGFEIITVTEVDTGNKYYAIFLETEYYNTMLDHGTAQNIIDADEVDNVISTLEYIKAHRSDLKNYTEIVYTAKSGVRVGAYHSISEESIFIELATDVRVLFDMDEIDKLINVINRANRLFGD